MEELELKHRLAIETEMSHKSVCVLRDERVTKPFGTKTTSRKWERMMGMRQRGERKERAIKLGVTWEYWGVFR